MIDTGATGSQIQSISILNGIQRLRVEVLSILGLKTSWMHQTSTLWLISNYSNSNSIRQLFLTVTVAYSWWWMFLVFPISIQIKAAPVVVDVLVAVVVCVVGLFVRAVPITDGNGANGGIWMHVCMCMSSFISGCSQIDIEYLHIYKPLRY